MRLGIFLSMGMFYDLKRVFFSLASFFRIVFGRLISCQCKMSKDVARTHRAQALDLSFNRCMN